MSSESKKKRRKRPYVPHEAAARFKPTHDWSRSKALDLYNKAAFDFPIDTIRFDDCIVGMAKLPDESIDTVIADPPFGISFSGKEALYNRDESFVVEGYQEVEGDYETFTNKWVSEIPRLLKKTGSVWIFSGWTNLRPMLSAIENVGLELVNHIIWQYQFGVFTRRKFVTSHYHLLFLVKNRKQYFFNKIEHYPLDIWEIKRTYNKGERKNGTKLPTELVMRCIDFSTKPGSIVLDPFMGNGTTAVASKGSYRHYLGFEINVSMKEIIDHNLKLLEIGELYSSYSERKDDLVERAKAKFGTE
ncbi:MAG: DNA-methyltransferase [Candidatus Thorarchaeota archaeon]